MPKATTIRSGPRRAEPLVAVAEIERGNIAIASIIPSETIDRTIASNPTRAPPSLRSMAGADEPYDHLPFFYSDLFDVGYEAVGQVDSRLRTVAEWGEPNRKGVVGYVDEDGRPRGFLLWDVWGKVDAARDLIRAGSPVGAAQLEELLA